MAVQDHYSAIPAATEPPKAKIVRFNRNQSTPSLELQVNIEGRDHVFALPLDALQEYDVSGPAAVEELRQIRVTLERLAEKLSAPAPETESR